ncbi:nitrogen fixation protein NifX [Paenibacillus sp. M1]|uniref:Nitrogen fixation protein NifX n=1 Tax=Paenibacillus haidiansis TaxID=1574488 RepID=A0ABU7VNU0_9BACL
MKVAFASDDGLTVNAHFGQSTQFVIYNVTKDGVAEFLEIRYIAPDRGGGDEHGKIEARIAAIEDCSLVFLMQIGASAAARVTRKKLMPVKVTMGSSIQGQLERLQEILRGKPPMWLAKILSEETIESS